MTNQYTPDSGGIETRPAQPGFSFFFDESLQEGRIKQLLSQISQKDILWDAEIEKLKSTLKIE